MFTPLYRRVTFAVLGTALAGVLVASPATAGASHHGEPNYHHHITKDFSSKKDFSDNEVRYFASGGNISLKLTTKRPVEAFVEECGGADLGKGVRFPKGTSKLHILASNVEPGTCFKVFLRSTSKKPTNVEGNLSGYRKL